MAAIYQLLNPLPESSEPHTFQLPSPSPSALTTELDSPSYARKKQKLSKDAAIFIKGEIQGDCRYPAYECRNMDLTTHHIAHKIHPLGKIMHYPRHVPYNSDRKAFGKKTRRNGFQVFQYEFQVKGGEKVYTMMWDYNIGLVRTTPLFKCMGYSKTTPAKMLNRNPGLREICHSITGGALVAQGYWMPFDAARAVAATFCWEIRYALTPIFGPDFPDHCLQLESDGYGSMVIDPVITERCTKQAHPYRTLEVDCPSDSAMVQQSPPNSSCSEVPQYTKRLRPKRRCLFQRPKNCTSDRTKANGSTIPTRTSPAPSECHHGDLLSPPRSIALSPHECPPTPDNVLPLATLCQDSRTDAEIEEDGAYSDDSVTTSNTNSMLLRSRHGSDGKNDEDIAMQGVQGEEDMITSSLSRNHPATTSTIPPISDERAAFLLLRLNLEARMWKHARIRERRASF